MTIPGNYRLYFYNAVRISYFLNNLQIYLNGTPIDTITTTPTNWGFYRNFVYPTLGVNTISFNGQDDPMTKILLYVIFNFIIFLHQGPPTLHRITV